MDRPDSLWSADLTKIYCGEDGWCPLIAVVDNGSREVPGYRFSRKGRALEATDALDRAVISRYTSKELSPRVSLCALTMVPSFWLGPIWRAPNIGEFVRNTYQVVSPDWNGVVERFFRTLKQECVWLHNFESFEQAEKIISQWIDNYNKNRLIHPWDIRPQKSGENNFIYYPRSLNWCRFPGGQYNGAKEKNEKVLARLIHKLRLREMNLTSE